MEDGFQPLQNDIVFDRLLKVCNCNQLREISQYFLMKTPFLPEIWTRRFLVCVFLACGFTARGPLQHSSTRAKSRGPGHAPPYRLAYRHRLRRFIVYPIGTDLGVYRSGRGAWPRAAHAAEGPTWRRPHPPRCGRYSKMLRPGRGSIVRMIEVIIIIIIIIVLVRLKYSIVFNTRKC